jgi:hypothetical protein
METRSGLVSERKTEVCGIAFGANPRDRKIVVRRCAYKAVRIPSLDFTTLRHFQTLLDHSSHKALLPLKHTNKSK